MPFSTDYANDILELAFGFSLSIKNHNKVFLGLCSNDPEADNGAFTELSGNGYGRVLLHQFGEQYPALMSEPADRLTSNVKQIGFTKATEAWDTVSGYGLFDTETGGTPFFYARLNSPVETPAGAVFLFDPGAFSIGISNVDEVINNT